MPSSISSSPSTYSRFFNLGFRWPTIFMVCSALAASSRLTITDAFWIISTAAPRSVTSTVGVAKGFGNSKPQQPKKSSKPLSSQQILKTLEKTYGGTTPAEITKGTERSIERVLQSQPPHVQLAIQLYRQVSTWNRPSQSIQPSTNNTNPLVPGEEINGTQHIQAELDQLLQQHNLTERDLHNLLQQVTWDASAYAKAARALTGEMPIDMQRKVQKGCNLLVEYASQAAEMEDDTDNDHNNLDQKQKTDATIRPTILDVGCGFGVLVPFFKKAGLQARQIHGIDLSPEMIRHAQDTMMHQYRDDDSTAAVEHVSVSSPTFTACDFLSYQPPSSMKDACYQGIIFCSSLHDMPNMMDVTLPKARDLLSPHGGVLVILHPQGASHVLAQSRSNPTMVPRGLPTKAELQDLEGFELIHAPTTAQSMAEAKEGYLAVLRRTPIE